MKKVIITTDFSSNASQAMEYVMELLKYNECQFYLLHVLKASTFISDDLMSMTPSTNLYEQLISSAKLKLDTYVNDIKLKYNNILHQFIPVVDYDNLIAAVNQLAEKHKADLIVMGTKGASNVAKKIIGSNTMHVIQGCKTPVLAVPHDYNYKPIHKVAFTSNYENEYCNDDLKALVKLVEKNDYQIDVLHVLNSNTLTKEQEAVKASLYNCFKNTTHEFIELETDGFIKAVSGYVETNNIDLLAMVNRNVGFWDRLFSEQKVEKLAYNINVPLLVM